MPAQVHTAAALRWIGAFKLVKALALLAVAFGLHHLAGKDVAAEMHRFVRAIRVNPTGPIGSALIHKAHGATGGQINLLILAAVVYAIVYGVEGVGLLARKRWAEYLTVVSTCLLLPVEVYEVFAHFTPVRIVVLVLNLMVAAYLIWQLRTTRGRSAKLTPLEISNSASATPAQG